MSHILKSLVGSAVLAATVALPVQAAVITQGFTFAVASGTDTSVGTHFHSSSGGDFGIPAGMGEVGRYFTEVVRALSEYNLTGLGAAASAFVTFRVDSLTGLFSEYQTPLGAATISIYAYQGNNQEDIADYQTPSVGTVGSFNTGGLLVGNLLSFDITSVFNNAITSGWNSLGIRLQTDPLPERGAMVFDTFRLTSDNQCTGPGCFNGVPVPATLPLVGLGLFGLLAIRRRVGH